MVAVPAVGWSRPRISRMVVVFPAPFGPRKPVTMPGSTEHVRSSTARVAPKTFVSPANSIIAAMISGCGVDDEVRDRAHARRVGVQGRRPTGQRQTGFRRPRLRRPGMVIDAGL